MVERMQALWETAKENVGFILVCLVIFAAIFLIAWLSERPLQIKRPKSKAAYIAYIGMFSAISGVLMVFEIPLFFAPEFYKLDLSELPVLICTFTLGPVAGVVSELVKILVKLMIKGTTTAFVGDFANFVVGCALILPASIIYHVKKTGKSAVCGMAAGGAIMTIFGSAFNAVYLLPKFASMYGMPLEAIIEMGSAVNSNINSVSTLVLFAVVPFNLLKAVIVSVITFPLYRRIGKALKIQY